MLTVIVIPETKGLSLEAMDALFGVVPHDREALQSGRLGAALNMHKFEDGADSHEAREKERTRNHVESV